MLTMILCPSLTDFNVSYNRCLAAALETCLFTVKHILFLNESPNCEYWSYGLLKKSMFWTFIYCTKPDQFEIIHRFPLSQSVLKNPIWGSWMA